MKRYIFLLIAFLTTQTITHAENVYVAPIKGTIERGVAAFVDRVMTDAEDEGAAAVIFEIDTPGGALDAALTIRDAILYSDIKTIAFIHPRAISAGALISLATDHIVMVEGGTIGAATAVDQQGNKASEKIISYFRNEMKATAEKTGRPSKLAEGMVDEDVDIEDLAPKGKLLTLTTEEAVEQGIAEHIITESNRSEQLVAVLKHYDLENANILRQTTNWTEVIVRWLTYPTLASLLMSLGFLGLIFEIQSPGWGIGGTLGLICLGLFFGSHLLVHLADWGEILLFLLGLILVFIDLFFVVGFGILAIPGVGLMMIGLFLSLMGRTELWTMDSISGALTPLLAAMIMTTLLAIFMIRMLPKSSFWERLVLTTEEKASDGYRTSPYEDFRGATGTALTDLRPSGTGEFDGRRVSVATEGNFLEKDTPITVVNIEGSYIIVRKADEVES
jgi:membrane-bound serine protease (ClpP class)